MVNPHGESPKFRPMLRYRLAVSPNPRQPCSRLPAARPVRKDVMKIRFSFVCAALLAAAIPAAAHHGTGASYDLSNPVTLQGSVTEFHYANPHPQLFFDVTGAG